MTIRKQPLTLISWLLAAGLLIGLYLNGAVRHARQVNTIMDNTDQSAYMDYAKSMAETNYTYIGGRNRMPVYPFLQSLLYEPGLSDEAFFRRGKYFNIFLSVGLLGGVFLIILRLLPFRASVNLLLITAFTVFIFKAGYFQTELLFYFLNFCCFLLMNKMLHRPQWRWGLLTGVFVGLTHLTKASVLVGLAFFVITAIFQTGYKFYEFYDRGKNNLRRLSLEAMSLSLVPLLFLATVYPYISTSKKVFGHYFYNVNSTFYIWYDSWEQAKQGTGAHNDQERWPDMPPEAIPSAAKYLREHTVGQMIGRIQAGFIIMLGNTVVYPFGYFTYFGLYLIVCLTAALANPAQTRNICNRYRALCLFNLAYFITYLLLYAWYTPIAAGHRLSLAQFLPLMFTFSFIIFRLYPKQLLAPYKGRPIDLARLLTNGISLWLIFDIYLVLSTKIINIYGGA